MKNKSLYLLVAIFLLVICVGGYVEAQQGPASGAGGGGAGSTGPTGPTGPTGVAGPCSGDINSSCSQVNSVQNAATGTTQTAGDSSTKLATTAFVANIAAGINPAVAVQEATTGVLPNSPSYTNGVAGVGATLIATGNAALVVDGVTVSVGDRILVKNQGSAFQNGVYVVTATGSVIALYTLTRALDYDQPSDMNNTGTIPVVSGTANAGTSWLQTSQVATVGTDAVTFTQFSFALANQIQTAIVTLTSAQLQANATTPVVVVPAPGAGKIIAVIGVALTYNFGTTVYSPINNGVNLFYAGDTALSQALLIPGTDINILGASNSVFAYIAGSVSAVPTTGFNILPGDDNKAIVMVGDNLNAGSPPGDGTLKVTTYYMVVPVP